MSVDRRIRRHFSTSQQLTKAGIVGEARAREEFQRGYKLLKKSLGAQGSLTYSRTEILTPEILVLCSETAVANSDFAVAHEASEAFFLGNPPEDQFFCRALFVRAQVESHNSRNATGQEAVDQVLIATGRLLRCVEISLSPLKFPRYNFIIYNVSVLFWNITRRLMRAGASRYLCEPMQRVAEALEKAGDAPISWRCRFQARLAQCYDDKGDSKLAAQCVLAAHDLVGKLAQEIASSAQENEEAKTAAAGGGGAEANAHAGETKSGDPALLAERRKELEALRRQVRDLGIYMGRLKKDGDCTKASSAVSTAWKTGGFYPPDAADLENVVQQCRAGVIGDNSAAKVEEALSTALASLEAKVQAKQAAVEAAAAAPPEEAEEARKKARGPALTWQELDCAAQIGLEAVRRFLFDVAERALVMVESIKQRPPTADVVAGYLRALFVVNSFEKRYDPVHSSGVIRPIPAQLPQKKLAALGLARRLEAIKILERALMTCHRLQLPNLLQDGCTLAWNIGMPLLTPRMRKHAHRLFVSAVKFLDEIESPLVSLRARLHFEVAKFEVASDFLSKALEHVNDALGVDYGHITVDVIDTPEFDITDGLAKKVAEDKCRVLDHHLMEIKTKLTLRSSLYNQPTDTIQKVLLMVEQAKGATDETFRGTVLVKAASILGLAEDPNAAAIAAAAASPKSAAARSDNEEDAEAGAIEDADAPEKPNSVERLQRTLLCSDIMTLMWELGESKISTRAANYILRYRWHPEQFRNLVFIQTQACLCLAEISVAAISTTFAKLEEAASLADQFGGASQGSLVDDDARLVGSNSGPAKAVEQKKKVIAHLKQALEQARSCESQAPWLVENVTKHVWNHHMGVVARNLRSSSTDLMLPELAGLFQDCVDALFGINSGDSEMICNLTRALAWRAELNGDFAGAVVTCARLDALGLSPETTQEVFIVRARAQFKDPKSGGKAAGVFAQPPHWKNKVLAAAALLQATKQTAVQNADSQDGKGSKSKGGSKGSKGAPPVQTPQAAKGGAVEPLVPRSDAKQLLEQAYACLNENASSTWASELADKDLTFEAVQESQALTARLWAELAQAGLALQQLERVQMCCYEASSLLPDNQSGRRRLSRKFWRYMSMVETSWGSAVAGLVAGESQSNEVKIKLREAALPHFVLGARWGSAAGDQQLVIGAARFFLEVSAPFLASTATRVKNLQPTSSILDEVRATVASGTGANLDAESWGAVVQLYLTILAVHKDRQDWQVGLDCCNAACAVVPTEHQAPLWSIKVLCLSRLGKNVAAAVAKMKNGSAGAQAAMWALLARNSSVPRTQLESYNKALKAVDKSFERTVYLVEVAEWMQRKGKFDTAASLLLQCVDVLLDVEHEKRLAAVQQTLQRGGGNNAAVADETQSDGDAVPETGGESGAAAATALGRKSLFRRTARVVVVLGNADSASPSRLNVSHLELAARCFTMLAQLATDATQRIYFASLARSQVVAMLQRAIDVVNFDVLKQRYVELVNSDEGKAELAALAKKLHQADVPVEQWAQLQQPPYVLPESLGDWTGYSIDPFLVERWAALSKSNPVLRPFALHGHCLPRLDVVCHYMHRLVDTLCETGRELEALPVLVVLEQLVRSAQPQPDAATFKCALSSGLAAGDIARLPASATPGVSLPLQCVYLKMSKVHAALGNSVGAVHSRVKAGKLGLTREQRLQYSTALAEGMPEQSSQQQGASASAGTNEYCGVLPKHFSVASLLLEQAASALEMGEVDAAKQLLVDAAGHVPILPPVGSGRQVLERRVALLSAAVRLHEGNFSLAKEQLAIAFQRGVIGAVADVTFVQRGLVLVCSFVRVYHGTEHGASLMKWLQAFLREAINQYSSLLAPPLEDDEEEKIPDAPSPRGRGKPKPPGIGMKLDMRLGRLQSEVLLARLCCDLAWELYDQQGSAGGAESDIRSVLDEAATLLHSILGSDKRLCLGRTSDGGGSAAAAATVSRKKQLRQEKELAAQGAGSDLVAHPEVIDAVLHCSAVHASSEALRVRVAAAGIKSSGGPSGGSSVSRAAILSSLRAVVEKRRQWQAHAEFQTQTLQCVPPERAAEGGAGTAPASNPRTFAYVPRKALQIAQCFIELGLAAVSEAEARVRERGAQQSGDDAHVQKWLFAIDSSRPDLTTTGPAEQAVSFYSNALALVGGGCLNTHSITDPSDSASTPTQETFFPGTIARSRALLLSAAACGIGRAAHNICRLAGSLGEDASHWGGDAAVKPSDQTAESLDAAMSSPVVESRLAPLTQAVVSAAAKAFEKENSDAALPTAVAHAVGTAVHRLLQSLHLAQQHSDIRGVRAASLQLAELFGSANASAAAEFLLLHQHARNVGTMQQLFRSASAPNSPVSTFLRLRQFLDESHPAPAATLAHRAATRFLSSKTAWASLNISGSNLAPLPVLLKTLPENLTVVSLQHAGGVASADSDEYDPAHDPDGDDSRGAPAQAVYATVLSNGRVVGTFRHAWAGNEAAELRELATRYETVCASLGRKLVTTSGAEVNPNPELQEIYSRLQSLFDGTPLVAWLERALSSLESEPSKASAPEHMCLLLDDLLDALPMECLGVLRASASRTVSRDFSLHTLVSRIVTLRRQQSKGSALSKVRAVVDPKDETDEVWSSFTHIRKAGGKLCGAWNAVTGREQHASSEGELSHTIAEASGFVFLGPQRLLGQLAPSKLASLDARECQFALLLDRAVNDVSNRRQMKLDSTKSQQHLNCEGVGQTARLFTLAGVPTVVLVRQACTAEALAACSVDVIARLDKGDSVAEAAAAGIQAQNLAVGLGEEGDVAGPCFPVVYGVPTFSLR